MLLASASLDNGEKLFKNVLRAITTKKVVQIK